MFDGGGMRHASRQWRTLEVIMNAAATRRAPHQNAPGTVPRTLLRKVGLLQCLGVGEPGASTWWTVICVSTRVRLNFTFNNSPPRSLPHGHAWVATSGLETFGASLPTKQLVSCGEARRHEKSPPSPTASLVSPPAGPARPLRRTRHARRGQPSAESLATPSHRSTFARWTCAVRFLLPPYPRQEQCSLESSGPFLSRMP